MMQPFTSDEKDHWLETLDKRAASATVILETPDEKILVLKSDYKQRWSIPGGFIEAGETSKTTAIREVREEIGLSLDPDRLDFYAVIDRTSDKAQTYQFIFYAKLASEAVDTIQLQPSEIQAFKLLSRHDIFAEPDQYTWPIVAWAERRRGYAETTIVN